MANSAISFLLLIVMFTSLKIEARDIQRFSKFVNKAEQPSFSSSKLPSPLQTKNNKDQGRYRQGSDEFRNIKSSDDDDNESDVPPKEFDQKIKKEFSFSNNYNHHSYVQQNYKNDINDFYYTPTKQALDPEDNIVYNNLNEKEEDKFVYNNLNEYRNFNRKETVNNVKEAEGMSDTRTLENGIYFYKPEKELSYYQGTVTGDSNFVNNQGYYGNGGDPKSKFHNVEEEELRWDP